MCLKILHKYMLAHENFYIRKTARTAVFYKIKQAQAACRRLPVIYNTGRIHHTDLEMIELSKQYK